MRVWQKNNKQTFDSANKIMSKKKKIVIPKYTRTISPKIGKHSVRDSERKIKIKEGRGERILVFAQNLITRISILHRSKEKKEKTRTTTVIQTAEHNTQYQKDTVMN